MPYKKICILVFLAFWSTHITASEVNPDSLLQVAQTASGKEKYLALKALGKLYRPSDPQKSLEYASEQRKVAAGLKDRQLEAEAMTDMAIPMTMMQDNKGAINLFQESVFIFDSLNDEAGKAKSLNNLGIAWSQYGSFDKSLSCYLEVIPYFTKKNDLINLGRVYMSMGLVYEQLKKYNQAISSGNKAREIFISLNNEKLIADVTTNMGITYQSMGEFRKSQAYFEEALAFYKKENNTFGMAVVMTNLARMYKAEKNINLAHSWYDKALPLIRAIHNSWAEASLFNDLAGIQISQGLWQEALASLNKALQLNRQTGDHTLESQIYHSFYMVYDTLRQDRLALDYFKKYKTVHDTLNSLQKARIIEELTIGFETAQKEAENQILKQEVKASEVRQRVIIGSFTLGLVVSILLIVLLILKRKNLILIKEQAERESKMKKIELENLEAERHLKETEFVKMETEKKLQEVQLEKMESEKRLHEEAVERLQFEIQLKEQELVYQTLLRMDMTRINRSVQEKLLPFQYKFPGKKDQAEYVQLIQEITHDAGNDAFADFEVMFKQIHKSFNEKLLARCNSLSKMELMICALLRINLSTKDIARLLNISASSVDMTRHRIRQKLELDAKENLNSFLITL